VALSAGALHATLVRTPPLAADVERLRAQRASATAQVTSVVVDRVDAGAVVVLVRLAERIVTDGQVSDQVTLNRAAIVRRRGAWRVVAFTLAP
jgi:ABC-type transporter Mla MlaB component